MCVMKIILTLYADVAGQHYGPGTQLLVSDELGQALIQQGKARMDEPPSAPVVNATSAAKELAAANGLDLTSIEGTGKGGLILKSDVEKALANG